MSRTYSNPASISSFASCIVLAALHVNSFGIDILVNYQEEEDKEEHVCAYAELERLFSSFIRHKHHSYSHG